MDPKVGKFLIETLQSVYGNLPQLISKISATKGITNDEAVRYVSSQLKDLTSPNSLSRHLDWTETERVRDLEAELSYLKEYYARGNSNVSVHRANARKCEIELTQARQRLARLERELASLESDSSNRSHDDVGMVEYLQDKLAEYRIERQRLVDRIAQLTDELADKETEHVDEQKRLREECARNAKRLGSLEARLETSRRENLQNAQQIRAIASMLNPTETDVTRATEMLDEFLARYRAQESVVEELKRLKKYTESEISRHISEIAKIPDSSCSDSDYVRQIAMLLLDEKLALQNAERRRDDDPSVRDKLIRSEALVDSLTRALDDSKREILAMERDRERMRERFDRANADREELQMKKNELEQRVSELNLTVNSLAANRSTISSKNDARPDTDRDSPADDKTDIDDNHDNDYNPATDNAALIAELRAAEKELESIRSRQAEKDETIRSLVSELSEKREALQKLNSRVVDFLDESVQTSESEGLLNPEISSAVRELKTRLEEIDVCINNSDDVAKLVETLLGRRDQPDELREIVEKLNALETENAKLRSHLEQLNCKINFEREIDSAIRKAEQSTAGNPDIVSMLAEIRAGGGGESESSENALNRAYWKRKRRKRGESRAPLPPAKRESRSRRKRKRVTADSDSEQVKFMRMNRHSDDDDDDDDSGDGAKPRPSTTVTMHDPLNSNEPIVVSMLSPVRQNLMVEYEVPEDPTFDLGPASDSIAEVNENDAGSPSIEQILSIEAALPDEQLAES